MHSAHGGKGSQGRGGSAEIQDKHMNAGLFTKTPRDERTPQNMQI